MHMPLKAIQAACWALGCPLMVLIPSWMAMYMFFSNRIFCMSSVQQKKKKYVRTYSLFKT